MNQSALRINKWFKLATFASAASLILLFQNCGLSAPFAVESFDSASSSSTSAVTNADLSWSTRAEKPALGTGNRISRWVDSTGKSISLYPPLRAGSSGLDLDFSGEQVVSGGHNVVRLGPEAFLSPAVADLGEFTSDRYTFTLVIRDIEFPSPAGTIRLVSLFPSNGDNAGIIVLDVSPTETGAVFSALHFFDGETYAAKNYSVTTEQLRKPLGIALRFDKNSNNLHLAINGRLSPEPLFVAAKPPPALANVSRSFTLHAPSNTFGSKGSFSIGEFGIYLSALRNAELVAASTELAAAWADKKSQFPSPGPSGTPLPTSTPVVFTGAQLYATKCMQCHGALATSAKRRITLDRLNSGIATYADMASLSSLSTADRQKIVDALQ